MDSVAEVKVMMTAYSAENGRNPLVDQRDYQEAAARGSMAAWRGISATKT